MPKVDSHRPLLPSLLDRLIDREPDVSTEPLWRGSFTVRDLEESVRRDLEALLNTRQTRSDLFGANCECSRSVLTYGLPDLTSLGADTHGDLDRLRIAVEQAIRLFEPRLRDVEVTIRPPADQVDRKLHLAICAVLQVAPITEQVAFDTVVETSTSTYEVESRS